MGVSFNVIFMLLEFAIFSLQNFEKCCKVAGKVTDYFQSLLGPCRRRSVEKVKT